MPEKFRPTVVTKHQGITKKTYYWLKGISKDELLKTVHEGGDKKRQAKARKELARRGIEYEVE